MTTDSVAAAGVTAVFTDGASGDVTASRAQATSTSAASRGVCFHDMYDSWRMMNDVFHLSMRTNPQNWASGDEL